MTYHSYINNKIIISTLNVFYLREYALPVLMFTISLTFYFYLCNINSNLDYFYLYLLNMYYVKKTFLRSKEVRSELS